MTAASATKQKRSVYFLDATFEDVRHGAEADSEHVDGLCDEGALRRSDLFHLSGDLQGWCQCELCFSWRKVADELYHSCTFDGAPYTCDGGCATPLSRDERRFAPVDAPGRQNQRLSRKR